MARRSSSSSHSCRNPSSSTSSSSVFFHSSNSSSSTQLCSSSSHPPVGSIGMFTPFLSCHTRHALTVLVMVFCCQMYQKWSNCMTMVFIAMTPTTRSPTIRMNMATTTTTTMSHLARHRCRLWWATHRTISTTSSRTHTRVSQHARRTRKSRRVLRRRLRRRLRRQHRRQRRRRRRRRRRRLPFLPEIRTACVVAAQYASAARLAACLFVQ